MNKASKMITGLLLMSMVLLSGALLYASIYASTKVATSSVDSVIAFDAPSGIRYNSTYNEFEVFTTAGVSWIARDRWIHVTGLVSTGPTIPSEWTSGECAQATGNSTYRIMNDITYRRPVTTDATVFFQSFDNDLATIGASGVVYGGNHILKDFPLRRHSTTNNYSSFFNDVAGQIKGLNTVYENYYPEELTNTSAVIGIIASTIANGEINGCNAVSTINSSGIIGGIVGSGSGKIINSTAGVTIVHASVAGGIMGQATGNVYISDCKVTGAITGTYTALELMEKDGDGNDKGTGIFVNYTRGTIGGILGNMTTAATARVYACVSEVDIIGRDTGGIIGEASVFDIRYCEAHGIVAGNALGGIIGYVRSGTGSLAIKGLYSNEVYTVAAFSTSGNSGGVSAVLIGYWTSVDASEYTVGGNINAATRGAFRGSSIWIGGNAHTIEKPVNLQGNYVYN